MYFALTTSWHVLKHHTDAFINNTKAFVVVLLWLTAADRAVSDSAGWDLKKFIFSPLSVFFLYRKCQTWPYNEKGVHLSFFCSITYTYLGSFLTCRCTRFDKARICHKSVLNSQFFPTYLQHTVYYIFWSSLRINGIQNVQVTLNASSHFVGGCVHFFNQLSPRGVTFLI